MTPAPMLATPGVPPAGDDRWRFEPKWDGCRLLARFDASFDAASTVDRAALLHMAARLLRQRPLRGALILLDVPLDHPADRELVAAAVAGADAVLATVPSGDTVAADAPRAVAATRIGARLGEGAVG